MTDNYKKRLVELGKKVTEARVGVGYRPDSKAVEFFAELDHLLGYISALELEEEKNDKI